MYLNSVIFYLFHMSNTVYAIACMINRNRVGARASPCFTPVRYGMISFVSPFFNRKLKSVYNFSTTLIMFGGIPYFASMANSNL